MRLRSPWGEMWVKARHSTDVRPGTLFLSFHFLETKTATLLSDVLDRFADCPEYKLTPVTVSVA